MKVRANEYFRDYKENVYREKGDEFEVTEERYQEMLAGLPDGYVEAVEEVDEVEAVEEVEKPQKTKKASTKKGE